MPRVARIKTPSGKYHIMVRSISDVLLFKESSDKDKYLSLVKKYQKIFLFKLYAYCLMTNHGHFIIDCNGADISKIMKSINQCYVYYFNQKYNRHGHLFQDRFKSKLVTNEKYLITLSIYIHNNPKDIDEYKNKIENYRYSSLGIYLGLSSDIFNLVDTSAILQYFGSDKAESRKSYLQTFDKISNNFNIDEKIDTQFENEGFESKNFTPEQIINFIIKHTGNPFNMHVKFNHRNSELKSICVLVMRSLCGYNFKDMCSIIGNITTSGLWRLCEKGYNLITNDDKYLTLFDDLIKEYSAN